jgi:hypothetical protein
MPFAVAGAAIGAGASLIGSSMQSSAIKSGQDQANAALQAQVGREQPFLDTGGQANTQMANLLGLNGQDAANTAMSTYQTSPGYQFEMQQGLRGVDAGAASTGTLRSGATIKAEDTFAQGLADSDFGQYYNRLSSMSGTGQAAASGDATTAANMAQTDTSAAAAQSSIYGNAAKGIGTSVNQLFSNPGFQSLFSNTGGGGGSGYVDSGSWD